MKITTSKDKWRVSNALKCLAMVLFSVSIAYGCASSAYKEAKEINTVEAYNEFLREHSGSEYVEDALKRRLDAAYEAAKSSNSIAAYDEFLRKYQRNRYTSSVLQLRDKSAFTNAERQNTIPAYEWYLREYPKGKFASRANSAIEKIRFDELSEENTIAAYRRYLRLHPKGKFVVQARNNIEKLSFDIAEKLNSIASYGSYLKDYPKGKFAATADDRRERLMFGQAEQRDTFDSYRKYLREYPEGEFAAIAAEKQELRAFDGAKARNTINSYGEYLNLYPDGKFAIEAYESKEELWFDKAKSEHSIKSYDDYLNEYPNGQFFRMAYQSKEELWFNQANGEHSINSYSDYLREYPDGEFADAAHESREELWYLEAEIGQNIDSYNAYLTKYPDGKFASDVARSREQLLSIRARQDFEEAKSRKTINSYWQYISKHPDSGNVLDALELLQSANREIIWTSNAKDSYDFRVALSPKDENFIGKLKDYPLYYFVYLYSQAAEGLYMLYDYNSYYLRFVEPTPPILELSALAIDDPRYPLKPELIKGEFETSAAFKERENTALEAWQEKKDLFEAPARERDNIRLAAWQKRQDNYQRAMTQRNDRSKHPGQALLWQFQAATTALFTSNLNLQLQYDADRQVFDYTIKSNYLNMIWQGELPIGLKAAEQFKVSISKPTNRQLHFYLSPSGMLQLAKITDLATGASLTTQNNSLQPIWLPDAANLAELPLHKLSLSSNLDNTITWIEGRTFGSTPMELLLPSETYEVEVAKHPYAFFSGYKNKVKLQADIFLEVDLELYGADKASQVQEEISWSIGSNHSYYTKIDKYGNELRRNAPTWACVRDNKTGLVWEVKSYDASIHNEYNKYRWGGKTISQITYKANSYRSRVSDSFEDWDGKSIIYGDWDTIIDGSNEEQLCSYSNWRVPNLDELSTLIRCYHEYEKVKYAGPHVGCIFESNGRSVLYYDEDLQRPTINTYWFPNTKTLRYWSANAEASSQDSAWCLEFDVGFDLNCNSSETLNLRLVRSSR